jgi:BirA family biotin operon repressor/biotin-[acetyl-CoA-carboxylase] ligase
VPVPPPPSEHRPALDADALRKALIGRFVTALDVVAETSSTNADLAAAARTGAAQGSVLVAEFQHAGRGRFARTWTSPPRAGLTFSVLVRPTVPVARWGWLPLLTGVALRQAVATLLPADVEVALKWPNDLLLGPDGVKAAGILAEASGAAVVIGLGVNVDNRADELPASGAGSLWLASPGRPVPRATLLVAVLTSLGGWYERWVEAGGDPDRSGLRTAYESACATLGATIEVRRPAATVVGRAVAIDGDGALIVARDDERFTVSAGDVAHIRAHNR